MYLPLYYALICLYTANRLRGRTETVCCIRKPCQKLLERLERHCELESLVLYERTCRINRRRQRRLTPPSRKRKMKDVCVESRGKPDGEGSSDKASPPNFHYHCSIFKPFCQEFFVVFLLFFFNCRFHTPRAEKESYCCSKYKINHFSFLSIATKAKLIDKNVTNAPAKQPPKKHTMYIIFLLSPSSCNSCQ